MKKIITAITLASLLGCTQEPKSDSRFNAKVSAAPKSSSVNVDAQESNDKNFFDYDLVLTRMPYSPVAEYSDPKSSVKNHDNHAFLHDSIQIPKQFSGTIKGWVANIGELCNADGLPIDIYTFVLETNKGEKELTVIGYDDDEKKYLKDVASIGTHVNCSYGVYASTSDMVGGVERYIAPFSKFKKSGENSK